MAKKIRSIKHLNVEKKRLQQRLAEVEKAIRYDWRDVKDSFKPKHLAGEVFSKLFEKDEQNGDTSLAAGLSHLAAALTKIAVEKAEEKVDDWLNKK
jgi:hypothetical protein